MTAVAFGVSQWCTGVNAAKGDACSCSLAKCACLVEPNKLLLWLFLALVGMLLLWFSLMMAAMLLLPLLLLRLTLNEGKPPTCQQHQAQQDQ
jgi:hypothetical protein